MEYLSLNFFEACENKIWKPINASRSRPTFSHLFLVDDLLLCTEASVTCRQTIFRVFDDFCSHSNQKINLVKSKEFFSPNVNPNFRHHLCDILGVASIPNLGKYMGFPPNSNGRNSKDFRFIVEKVQAKLSSWNAKLLSHAGHVILIQSITLTIPVYYM